MADYYSAEINIPLSYVVSNENLIKIIEEYCNEYGDGPSMNDVIEERVWEDDYIEIHIVGEPGKDIFSLRDGEARYGYFKEIEEFCLEHAIPFDRHTYGDYEMGGDFTYWYRPGMTQGFDSMTPNNRSHVSVSFIKSVLDSQPEEVSDEEALNYLMERINVVTHDSPINLLENWCSRGMIEC